MSTQIVDGIVRVSWLFLPHCRIGEGSNRLETVIVRGEFIELTELKGSVI